MSLVKDLIGGAVRGVKTLTHRARVGRQAIDAGFLQPRIVEQQQAQTAQAVAQTQSNLYRVVLIFVGAIAFFGILFSIIKRK
jgi:hypothetical protein